MNFGASLAYYGSSFLPTKVKPSRPFRVDTNVLSLSVARLPQPDAAPGRFTRGSPPLCCRACDAVFGYGSELKQSRSQGRVWVCEYCGHITAVPPAVEKELFGLSVKKVADFTLEAETSHPVPDGMKDRHIIFCVDVSGSMCVSSFVGERNHWACPKCTLHNPMDADHCSACGYKAPITLRQPDVYLSRLYAMQHMVCSQIDTLKAQNPDNHVGLVAFSDAVTLYGDGTGAVAVIDEGRLYEFEELVAAGERMRLSAKPLGECDEGLKKHCQGLRAHGQTALGPALLVCLAAAGRTAGSQVIICTDGLSNVGVGALSKYPTDLEREFSSAFYKRATEYAVGKGVAVSVISIEGEDCNLVELGSLAQATGGSVQRVRPDQLDTAASTVTSDMVVASQVEMRMVLHTSLQPYAMCQPDRNLAGLNSQVHRLASVTSNSEVVFQFGPATPEKIAALPRPPTSPLRVPFQLQVRYTNLAGQHCMRVFTDDLPVTDDLNHAKTNMDVDLLIMHGARSSAQLALAKDFDGAVELSSIFKEFIDSCRDGAEDKLYDNFDEAVHFLRAAPTAGYGPVDDSPAAAGDAANRSIVNGAYETPSFIADDTADALFQMRNLRRRSQPLADCNIVEDVDGEYAIARDDVMRISRFRDPDHDADYDVADYDHVDMGLYQEVSPEPETA